MATSGAGAVGRYPDASDASLAVGPTRQVLLVNDRFRITRRTTPVTNSLLTTGSQTSFAGAPARRPSYANDLIWDAKTNRFYFVVAAWDTRPPATIYSDLKTPTGEKLYGHDRRAGWFNRHPPDDRLAELRLLPKDGVSKLGPSPRGAALLQSR